MTSPLLVFIVGFIATPALALKFRPNPAVQFRQTLENINDLSYYGNITVGGQHLTGIFDTGSIELAVLSGECASMCGDQRKPLYNHSASSSYLHGNYTLSLSYGSGDLSGEEAYDTLQIGPFVAPTAPFWEIVYAQMPLLSTSDFQSIVGLGPIPDAVSMLEPGSNDSHAYALALGSLNFTNLRFSFCLGKDEGSPGYLTWNDLSLDTIPQAFTTLEVKGSNYWMAKLEDVQIGTGPLACTTGCGAVLDSGTSLIAVPSDAKLAFEMQLRDVISDCSKMEELPAFRFKLNGVQYALPADSYLATISGTPPGEVVRSFQPKNTTACQLSMMTIQLSSSLGETWILGMPFFREFYTVFEQRKPGQPPRMHTALTDSLCQPMGTTNTTSLGGTGHRQGLRHINVSKLRLPPWVRTTRAVKRINESSRFGHPETEARFRYKK